jgi:hypothetical protein
VAFVVFSKFSNSREGGGGKELVLNKATIFEKY